jgi:hypothetical protein
MFSWTCSSPRDQSMNPRQESDQKRRAHLGTGGAKLIIVFLHILHRIHILPKPKLEHQKRPQPKRMFPLFAHMLVNQPLDRGGTK